jgi:hypothetical protein
MILAIEWEHEVRVLLRSNRTRSSPASFEDWGGGRPRTSDPFVVPNVPTSTDPGPLTRLRIVPFDRGVATCVWGSLATRIIARLPSLLHTVHRVRPLLAPKGNLGDPWHQLNSIASDR